MATLSKADKDNLTAEEQRQVLKAKQDWEAAYAAGDQAAMDAAHAAAEKVRNNAYAGGYTGGDAGNSYTSLANKNAYQSTNNYLQNSYSNGYSNLSQADSALLNAQQQAQISALKEQYAAALTQADKDRIHAEAEAIRASAGYTAGADGTGYQVLAANAGGMTAEQMRKWLEDYEAVNYRNGTGLGSGWVNGYSTGMNVRSKANKIRQQMQANELAMANADQATKDQLHQENLALAQLLYDYTGQSKKNTWYNEELGRWETYNSDVGYGTDVSWDYPGVADSHKQYLGYTDADIQKYANDTSLYYNFVDPRTNRLAYDESSGYTGQYAQFVNGPYAQLLTGSHPSNVSMETYLDVTGDGFNDDDVSNITFTPVRDANGNVINKVQPALKNNNAMSDYTNQFTSYVQGGVIQPGLLVAARPSSGAYTHKTGNYARGDDPRYTGGVNRDVAGSTPEDKNNVAGQRDYWEKYGQYSKRNSGNAAGSSASGTGVGGAGNSGQVEQVYSAALQAQLEGLKTAYEKSLSDLEAESGRVEDLYEEEMRRADGDAAQMAAGWREVANAYGLNSGAIGQAALAMSNQRQSNLNTLSRARAAAQAEIQRQRSLLGKEYQSAINQALAENNYAKASALYEEAVRAEELLWEKEKYYTSLALDQLTAML